MSYSFIPINFPEFNIYDIFYNENSNNLIIIMPAEQRPPFKIALLGTNKTFTLVKCPHNHTYIYKMSQIYYEKKINLIFNNDENKKLLNVSVNKYPLLDNEIILSTMVLNEDNFIRQWIDYHLLKGINKFIIYDNEGVNDCKSYKSDTSIKSNLPMVLKEYIDNNIVILIKWPYKKRYGRSGISGQTCQQNHSIYAFNTCKYIGLLDIDEYLNPQNFETINETLNSIISANNLKVNEIGSFKISNRFFCNYNNLDSSGLNFLSIFNCEKKCTNDRKKQIVIPKNVDCVSIHKTLIGKNGFNVNSKDIFFNHYYYLNKGWRCKRRKGNAIDNSIITALVSNNLNIDNNKINKREELHVNNIINGFIKNGILKLKGNYNHIFGMIYKGITKELYLEYIDKEGILKTNIISQNSNVSISNIKLVKKAIYRLPESYEFNKD